jgi:hypothetical protein
MSKNSSILIISDQHIPYHHPDLIKFLKSIKEKYKPDRIINIGDELDYHAISFHDSDPGLMSPSDELKTALGCLKPLINLFPTMDIVESNHGSLVYRKAKTHGLPREVFKSYREILGAPQSWKWHNHIVLKMSNGASAYFCHSKGGDVMKVSQSLGMSVVQGHSHNQFEIRYWGNSLGLYFGMTVGCLIDDDSMAFHYNKLTLKRPLIGCAVIINGHPLLIPMILGKDRRWIGVLP